MLSILNAKVISLKKKTMKYYYIKFLILLSIFNYGQSTYYFKCSVASATTNIYNYSNPGNWYTDPACSIPSGAIPTSTNNVVFNSNMFSSGNQTVNFNLNNLLCKDFDVNYSGAYTNCALFGSISSKLFCFGNFNLTNLDTNKCKISLWNINLELNTSNTSSLSVVTASNTLFFNQIEIPGNTINKIVSFNDPLYLELKSFTIGKILVANGYTNSNAITVNFNQVLILGRTNTNLLGELNVQAGIVNLKNGIFCNAISTLTNTLGNSATSPKGGILAVNSSSVSISNHSVSSGISGYNIPLNRSDLWAIWVDGSNNGSNSIGVCTLVAQTCSLNTLGAFTMHKANVNINNSIINAKDLSSPTIGNGSKFNWAITNSSSLTALGSTLNIISPTEDAYFNYGSFNYNVVNIMSRCRVNNLIGPPYVVANNSIATFNQLNIVNPVSFIHTSINSTIVINAAGTLSLAPGASIINNSVGSNTITTYSISPTATLAILSSNCDKKIYLNKINFNIQTSSTNVIADNLILSACTASGSSSPYNAGSNSIFIIGSINSGWIASCSFLPRTLYWQGTPAGGKWSDQNNWSTSPSANPLTPSTLTACPPTIFDSLVFGNMSNVLIDVPTAFCGSLRIIGATSFSNTNLNASWEIYGGYWADVRVINNYKGQIIFKTFYKNHFIKTGGTPFNSNSNSIFNSAVIFDAQFPPNTFSCLSNTISGRGSWVLVDTFGVINSRTGISFLNGTLNTFTNSSMTNVSWLSTFGTSVSACPNCSSPYPFFTGNSKKNGSTIYCQSSSNCINVDKNIDLYLYDSDIYLFNLSGYPNKSGIIIQTNSSLGFNGGTAEIINASVSDPNSVANNSIVTSGISIDEVTIKTFSLNPIFTPTWAVGQYTIIPVSQSSTVNATNVGIYMNNTTINKITNYQNLKIFPNISGNFGLTSTLTSLYNGQNSHLEINNSGVNSTYTINNLVIQNNTDIINTTNTNSLSLLLNNLFDMSYGGINLRLGTNSPNQYNNNVSIFFSNGSSFLSNPNCLNKNKILSFSPIGTSTVYSSFNLLGSITQSIINTDVSDNIVFGGTLSTSGLLNGITVGWTNTTVLPRILHWVDAVNSATAASVSTSLSAMYDWTNPFRWQKNVNPIANTNSTVGISNLIWGLPGECPPTCLDEVYIDNSSFSAIPNDAVYISNLNCQAECGRFFWNTSIGTPSFSGVSNSCLSICESFSLSNAMTYNYLGDLKLKGSPTSFTTSSFNLKFASNSIKGRILIDCYKSTSVYNMTDNIVSTYTSNAFKPVDDYSSIVHNAGILNTNGNSMNLYRYSSIGSQKRQLIADNSTITINGYNYDLSYSLPAITPILPKVGWIVVNTNTLGPKTYSISTLNTSFAFNCANTGSCSGIIGGGYNYNNVTFFGSYGNGIIAASYNNALLPGYNNLSASLTDTFVNVFNNINTSSTNDRIIIGPNSISNVVLYNSSFIPNSTYTIDNYVSNVVINNLYNNNSAMDVLNTSCDFGVLECNYCNNSIYNIKTSNKYYYKLGLYTNAFSAQTLRLDPSKVQWLQNNCSFYPSGNNSYKISILSSINNQSSFLRKDSGIVCADWLILKDIWAIGNGSSLGPVTITSCPTSTLTNPYFCDYDIYSTFDALGYGPINAPLGVMDPVITGTTGLPSGSSGRAWFKPGVGTVMASNNRGWDTVNVDPNPIANLNTPTTICQGATSAITFSLQGLLPYILTYTSNSNGPSFPTVSNVSNTVIINAPTSLTNTPSTAAYCSTCVPGYTLFMVPSNGSSVAVGTSSNPCVLSIQVSPTVTTQYSVGNLTTGKCINPTSTPPVNTGTIQITVNPAPINMAAMATPSVICNNGLTTYTANATYGSTYTLLPTSTATSGGLTMSSYTTGSAVNGSLSLSSFTASGASQNYTLFASSTSSLGCKSLTNTPVVLTVNPNPTINITPNPAAICSGNSTTLTASGANTYTLNPGLIAGSSFTLNPSTTQTYTVVGMSSANCVSSNTVNATVSVNITPTVNFSTTGTAICSGSTTTLSASGASTYTWTNPVINTASVSVSPNSTTIYTVVGKSTANCNSAPQQVTVTVNPTPTVNISGINAICSSQSATLLASGANSYNWVSGPVTANYVVSPNTNTTYTVTGTNTAGNCTNTSIYTVSVSTTPTVNITAVNNVICVGQTASLSASGATSYTWTNPLNTTSQLTVNPISNTSYSLVGITGSCTSVPQVMTVTVNPLPLLSITGSTSICNGQNTNLTVNGATSYTWNTASNANTINVSPSGSTNYSVIGIDANGCVNTKSVSLTVNPNPTLTVAGSSVMCIGQTVSLSVSGANTYTWSTGATASSITANPASTTVYSITGLNTIGNCINAITFTVNVNSLPILNITGQNQICNGTNAVLTVNGANTYTWSNGTVGNTVSVNPGSNQTYSVIGLIGTTSCSNTSNYSISVANTPTLSLSTNSLLICGGNTGNLVVNSNNGATNFNWTGSGIVSGNNTQTITVNASGQYSVTASQTTGTLLCSSPMAVANVTVTPVLNATYQVDNVKCFNQSTGSTTVSVVGGTPIYNYSWTPNVSTQSVITNQAAGSYTCVITDINNCTTQNIITINQPASALTSSIANTSSVSCFGGTNGAASVNVNGGTAGYTFSWTPNLETTNTASNLSQGSYTCTITDANGCLDKQVVTINQPNSSLTSVASTTANNSCTSPNGIGVVNATGGTGILLINWDAGVVNNFTNNSLPTGLSNYTVTDANGCSLTGTVNIGNTALPTLALANLNNSKCNGSNNGSAQFNTSGGTPTYSYLLQTNSNTTTVNTGLLTNLSAGEYTLNLVDAGNCKASQTFTITEPEKLSANATVQNACPEESNGSINLIVSGGTPSYNINWSNGQAGTTLDNIVAGNYTATVTDVNLCRTTQTVEVQAQNDLGCTILIPTFLSPDGDGKNDTWVIKGIEGYPNNKITVLNRWGNIVMERKAYNNDWDGRNEGLFSTGKGYLPAGTYFFIIDLGTGKKPIQGYMQLEN